MQGVLSLPVVCRNQLPRNIKSASFTIQFDTPVLEWFEKHHKNCECCALSHWNGRNPKWSTNWLIRVFERDTCMSEKQWLWREGRNKTKTPRNTIYPNIKSNMWGREEREEWSEPRGGTRAPVDVWREGCSHDQDHEDDDDEVEEEDDGGGGG